MDEERYLDSCFEAWRDGEGPKYKCSKCGAVIMGPLPGFPVWWLDVSYSVVHGPTHGTCGGYLLNEKEANMQDGVASDELKDLCSLTHEQRHLLDGIGDKLHEVVIELESILPEDNGLVMAAQAALSSMVSTLSHIETDRDLFIFGSSIVDLCLWHGDGGQDDQQLKAIIVPIGNMHYVAVESGDVNYNRIILFNVQNVARLKKSTFVVELSGWREIAEIGPRDGLERE